MPTDPLTAARYPSSSATPNVATDIQNAVNDLSDDTTPAFSTVAARNTAFTNWVNAGNTMRNGLMCSVAGYPMIYRSGAWHGIGGPVYTASSVDTTVYTSSHTVMTLSVPDPQFSYRLEVYGSVLLQQIGIGVAVRGIQRVNGTAVNPNGTLFVNTTGTTILSGVLITSGGPGISGTLTGAATVDFLINKEAGAAGNGFQATGGADPFWILSAKVLPV